LLFLCAGSVIHLIHSNDMQDMGGLRKKMPVTHACFLIACLAIAGIPPFSGFFSKEEILLAAFHSNKVIYATGLFVSGLTAFYMFRLYFSIFWRDRVGAADHHDSHGEGGLTMKIPLIILAGCTILAGFVPFAQYVSPDGIAMESHMKIAFSVAPVALALLGIGIAIVLYKKENDRAQRMAAAFGGFYRAAYRKFYVDEVYLFVTKKVIFNLIGRPAAWIDRNIVDGSMNGLATVTAGISEGIKKMQSGKIQSYVLYFFMGIAGLAILFIYIWK
jgi:NADH-quinone oxidoreductase subunit L